MDSAVARQPSAPRPLVVAGPSGSGKSTLLSLLFKEYPNIFGFSVSREFVRRVQLDVAETTLRGGLGWADHTSIFAASIF